jgi:hypothetical protein
VDVAEGVLDDVIDGVTVGEVVICCVFVREGLDDRVEDRLRVLVGVPVGG